MRRWMLASGFVFLAGCGGGSGKSSTTPPGTVHLGIEPWTVQAGEDRIWCKTMKVPGNATIDANSFHITMTSGSHHFILYRSSQSYPDGFGDCPPMGGEATFVTGSQTPDATYSYPAGLAMPLFAGEQLILQTHYANASGAAITGQVDVDIQTIPHSQVTDYLQTVLVVDGSFDIPPMTNGYTHGDTQAELDGLKIYSLSSHTHKRGVHFTIDRQTPGGTTNVYDNTDWHSPKIQVYDPPLQSSSANTLHYQCTWNNETTHDITFGPTTEDEMCIMVVTFYPALSWHP